MEYASCRGTDTRLFFTVRGESTVDARRVCMTCVVREVCLEYAIANGEKFGVWGGKTVKERRTIRNARRKLAA